MNYYVVWNAVYVYVSFYFINILTFVVRKGNQQ